ncbi:fasciclin domain-containing protein [Mongoliitalea daihaiensis]|uniref:fasciclin domain-containing protein n=1 Tax=Mongoliitalea daihaiensis TaxID=2782006 RepID=UPI001F45366D|nr:fasciclin domain-containing protein [Mongoliitalea daihaiensis]UJP63493.1 fasciclin domain-containing protein [Mongoliitalea daihaiensis]
MLNLKNYFSLLVVLGFTTLGACVSDDEPQAEVEEQELTLTEHLRNLQNTDMDLFLDAIPEFWESLEQIQGITLFEPSPAAFLAFREANNADSVEEAIEIVGKETLEEFLSYHVINEVVRFDNLPEGDHLFRTISGLPIVLRRTTAPPRGFVVDGSGGEVIVNLGGVPIRNGVSYLTSRILVPRPN